MPMVRAKHLIVQPDGLVRFVAGTPSSVTASGSSVYAGSDATGQPDFVAVDSLRASTGAVVLTLNNTGTATAARNKTATPAVLTLTAGTGGQITISGAPGTVVTVPAAYYGDAPTADRGGTTHDAAASLSHLFVEATTATGIASVRAATASAADTTGWTYQPTAEGTINGAIWTGVASPTVDGIALADGDRVLVKNAADPRGNGVFVYDATAQALRRPRDADAVLHAPQLSGGRAVVVLEGTVNAGKAFCLSGKTTPVPGTDSIVVVPSVEPSLDFSVGAGLDTSVPSGTVSIDATNATTITDLVVGDPPDFNNGLFPVYHLLVDRSGSIRASPWYGVFANDVTIPDGEAFATEQIGESDTDVIHDHVRLTTTSVSFSEFAGGDITFNRSPGVSGDITVSGALTTCSGLSVPDLWFEAAGSRAEVDASGNLVVKISSGETVFTIRNDDVFQPAGNTGIRVSGSAQSATNRPPAGYRESTTLGSMVSIRTEDDGATILFGSDSVIGWRAPWRSGGSGIPPLLIDPTTREAGIEDVAPFDVDTPTAATTYLLLRQGTSTWYQATAGWLCLYIDQVHCKGRILARGSGGVGFGHSNSGLDASSGDLEVRLTHFGSVSLKLTTNQIVGSHKFAVSPSTTIPTATVTLGTGAALSSSTAPREFRLGGSDPNTTMKLVFTNDEPVVAFGSNIRAFRLPRSLNTSHAPNPVLGDITLNTDTDSLEFYDGSTWTPVGTDLGPSFGYDEVQYAGSNPIINFFQNAPMSKDVTWVFIEGKPLDNGQFDIVGGNDLQLNLGSIPFPVNNGDWIWARYYY